MHRYLPRQSDIDKIMEQIKRKYLTKLQLPCSLRDMQAAYLNSPHFRDIYLAVGMNKLPNTTRSAKNLENDLRNAVYMIHGGLLYKYIQTCTGDSEPVLCIPVSKIDISLELFHSSILSGHMGMSKCVLTLQQKFIVQIWLTMLECILYLVMYAKLSKIIKDLTDPLIEELLI